MNLKAGVVLQKGKYTIDGVLGQGGFGITYRAIHHHLSQIVVLKTLNESLHHHQDFPKFQGQFRSEAHLLANSQHPNIVKVWDCFEEDELFFMVMDYIPGQNLAELVQSGHNLHPNQAFHYIHQIASALSVVHKNEFLHRDIQPKNIIRRAGTNTVVLTDFGMACDLTDGIRQTHTNLFSVGYAPPEQCHPQQNLTPATDIYALTATFYFLLAGKAPVPAPLRLSQAVPQALRVPSNELKLLLPHLHPAIEKTLVRGLELDSQKRPQTVESWFAILLDKSQDLVVKQPNMTLKNPSTKSTNLLAVKQPNMTLKNPSNSNSVVNNSVVNNNDESMDKKLVATVKKNHSENYLNEAKINTVRQRHLEQNQFLSYSYLPNKFSRTNQLSLQLTIFSLFLLTAATFGWIGFDITLRYSHIKTRKTTAMTSDELLENLKNKSNYNFRTQDPSSPLFDSPSVKTYSAIPPKLNKLPKPYFNQEEVLPSSWSFSDEANSFPEKKYYSSDSKPQVPNYNYSEYQDKNDYY